MMVAAGWPLGAVVPGGAGRAAEAPTTGGAVAGGMVAGIGRVGVGAGVVVGAGAIVMSG